METKIYIGVDVSKATFDVAYPQENKIFHTAIFDNTAKGVKSFIDTLDKSKHQVVLEATGYYSLLLCHLLSVAGVPFSLLNPRQSANFAKIQGATVKTDKNDAVLLAQLGKQLCPQVTILKSGAWYELKQKRVYLRQLKKQRTAMSNLKESLLACPYPNRQVLTGIDESIAFFNAQIAHLESIDDFQVEEFKDLFDRITTIKGVGKETATELIFATGRHSANGFTDFVEAKPFSKFIGICPTYSPLLVFFHQQNLL